MSVPVPRPLAALVLIALPFAVHAAQLSPAEADAEAKRTKANQEQSDFARAQVEENARNQAAYEAAIKAHQEAVAAHEAELARQQADAARVQAEYDRKQAEYQAAVKQWEADVIACKKGNRKRCAQPAPK